MCFSTNQATFQQTKQNSEKLSFNLLSFLLAQLHTYSLFISTYKHTLNVNHYTIY